ncbi:hypothetical protein [Aquimarina celericrescens]|uniref:DUF2019 domain-containing protein n=1 Tax=Aquimarina celericrescens TaxID=1964542 RepID=A0ABW5AW47_9FLAO|nr:hypothetical protein [Aquimarina celericrescens]
MKFKNVTEAKKKLISAIEKHHEAALAGDHKKGNKNSDIILSTLDFIDKNYGFEEMKDLLDHKNEKVRVWVAKSLLPIYEDIAITILEEIGKKNIPHCSFDARIILSEWKNEPLKFS